MLRYVAVHDVGRAINPMRVEGQIQGGAMQGIGYALFGARGIGEPPIGPAAPALANAIANAIGARPHRLPMTPERVLALIDGTRGASWKHQSE